MNMNIILSQNDSMLFAFKQFSLTLIYRSKDVIYNVSDNTTRLMLTIHVKSKDNLWFASQISSKITSFCKKLIVVSFIYDQTFHLRALKRRIYFFLLQNNMVLEKDIYYPNWHLQTLISLHYVFAFLIAKKKLQKYLFSLTFKQ